MRLHWNNRPIIRRPIFWAATLTPVLMVLILIVLPLQAVLAERDAEIAQKTEMLGRLTAIADYQPRVVAADRLAETKDEYLTGPSQGVAIANLQARLKLISETSGAKLRALESLQPAKEGPLSYIGARLDIFGSLQPVQRTIDAIEEAKPYFFITGAMMKLSLQSAMPGNAEVEPIIDAQIDVFGAFQVEGVR